jgi:hypothetical protein
MKAAIGQMLRDVPALVAALLFFGCLWLIWTVGRRDD